MKNPERNRLTDDAIQRQVGEPAENREWKKGALILSEKWAYNLIENHPESVIKFVDHVNRLNKDN
jgi:hypothetical protein